VTISDLCDGQSLEGAHELNVDRTTDQALAIMRDPQSIATVFTVEVPDGTDIVVDVEDPDDPVRLRNHL